MRGYLSLMPILGYLLLPLHISPPDRVNQGGLILSGQLIPRQGRCNRGAINPILITLHRRTYLPFWQGRYAQSLGSPERGSCGLLAHLRLSRALSPQWCDYVCVGHLQGRHSFCTTPPANPIVLPCRTLHPRPRAATHGHQRRCYLRHRPRTDRDRRHRACQKLRTGLDIQTSEQIALCRSTHSRILNRRQRMPRRRQMPVPHQLSRQCQMRAIRVNDQSNTHQLQNSHKGKAHPTIRRSTRLRLAHARVGGRRRGFDGRRGDRGGGRRGRVGFTPHTRGGGVFSMHYGGNFVFRRCTALRGIIVLRTIADRLRPRGGGGRRGGGHCVGAVLFVLLLPLLLLRRMVLRCG